MEAGAARGHYGEPKLINSERAIESTGDRKLTTDYRIDADNRSFASAAIPVIRGFILRTAEGRKVELGTQEFKNGALEEALRLQLQGLRTFREN